METEPTSRWVISVRLQGRSEQFYAGKGAFPQWTRRRGDSHQYLSREHAEAEATWLKDHLETIVATDVEEIVYRS